MLGAVGGATAQRKTGYAERALDARAEPLRERASKRMAVVGFRGAWMSLRTTR